MQEPRHILVVDDDGDVRDTVVALLQDLSYRVSTASGGETMRSFLEGPDPVDLIVLDAEMPGEPSVTLALHAKDRGIRLVMISGDPTAMETYHTRADQLLWKPFRRADLERALQHAFVSETFGQRKEDPD
jgi:DNA-binding NtrC family response regulator